ncbi:hypothetical protein [Streptomyces sp. NPDC057115]|uniref:hypothetical protein n=1 Tax=unclassified Streptomyces TaxID=2593676 RepID=UPI00363CCB74
MTQPENAYQTRPIDLLKRARDIHRETCILARGEVRPAAYRCGMCEALDAPVAVSAAVAPPTDPTHGLSVQHAADQTALRDRIAEALMRWTERGNSPQYAAMRRPETVRANAYSRADAVLAVLPPTDRAAVLREAADAIDATFTGPGLDRYTRYGADLLRRLADECPQCGTTGACNGGPCPLRRMADETATTEVVPCMRPEPHPAHSHSGLRKGTAVHGRCPGVPAAGARQDGAQQ